MEIVTIFLDMDMREFEKAKNSLIIAVETFLTCEKYEQVEEDIDGFDESENFFISALYKYIDFIKIISYEKIGNLKKFVIYVPMLGREIIVLLEYSDNIPFRIKFEENQA